MASNLKGSRKPGKLDGREETGALQYKKKNFKGKHLRWKGIVTCSASGREAPKEIKWTGIKKKKAGGSRPPRRFGPVTEPLTKKEAGNRLPQSEGGSGTIGTKGEGKNSNKSDS